MTQEDKNTLLNKLNEQQLSLQSVMASSDAHAEKCVKLGLVFKDEYPEEYTTYTEARQQYNDNEEEIARIEATEVDVEPIGEIEQ